MEGISIALVLVLVLLLLLLVLVLVLMLFPLARIFNAISSFGGIKGHHLSFVRCWPNKILFVL